MCALAAGNHIIHDELQWLRSDENPPSNKQVNRSMSIDQWSSSEDLVIQKERSILMNSFSIFLDHYHVMCSKSKQALYSLVFSSYCYGQRLAKEYTLLGLTPVKLYAQQRNYQSELTDYVKSHPCASSDTITLNEALKSILSLYHK